MMEEKDPQQQQRTPDEERKQVKELLNSCKMRDNQDWFVINFKWFQQWRAYVNEDEEAASGSGSGGPRPEAINNEELLVDPNDPNKLKPGLVENYDYVVVPNTVWNLLFSWYSPASSSFFLSILSSPSSFTPRNLTLPFFLRYGGGPPILRKVVSVGLHQALRVDLYPISIIWTKLGTTCNTMMQKGGKIHVSRQTTVKGLLMKITSATLVPPHKVKHGICSKFVFEILILSLSLCVCVCVHVSAIGPVVG